MLLLLRSLSFRGGTTGMKTLCPPDLLTGPPVKTLWSGSKQHCAMIFGTKMITGVPECAFFY